MRCDADTRWGGGGAGARARLSAAGVSRKVDSKTRLPVLVARIFVHAEVYYVFSVGFNVCDFFPLFRAFSLRADADARCDARRMIPVKRKKTKGSRVVLIIAML